ncbi:MAG TPA: patatin-like phospholipase family protein [Burkholderiaceae bacterium]
MGPVEPPLAFPSADAASSVEVAGTPARPAATYVCLGGGSALGAYAGGAMEALIEGGIEPDVLCGVSVGATVGAIVARNRPEDRLARLRGYWEAASSGDIPMLPIAFDGQALSAARLPTFGPTAFRTTSNALHALGSLLTGRPGFFRPRWPGLFSLLPFMPPDNGLFDPRPLIETLQRFINFDLLNREGPRLLVHAVDVETGEPVRFDSRAGGISPEHLVAATSLPPAFPPMRIGGRQIVDAGLVANVPLDHALFEASGRRTVIAVDPFCLRGPPPRSLDDSLHRAQDLAFAAQTERTLAALRRERHLRYAALAGAPAADSQGPVDLLLASYQAPLQATGAKTLDFSERSLRERWRCGHADMTQLLDHRSAGRHSEAADGLAIYRNRPSPA